MNRIKLLPVSCAAAAFLAAACSIVELAQAQPHQPQTRPAQTRPSLPQTRPAVALELRRALEATKRPRLLVPYHRDDRLEEWLMQRDGRMKALAEAVASLPQGQTVQCLAVDGIVATSDGSIRHSLTLICHPLNVDAEHWRRFDELQPKRLTEKQWNYLHSFAVQVSAATPPDTFRQRLTNVAVVTHWDGSNWHQTVWTNVGGLVNCPDSLAGLITIVWWIDASISWVEVPDPDVLEHFESLEAKEGSEPFRIPRGAK